MRLSGLLSSLFPFSWSLHLLSYSYTSPINLGGLERGWTVSPYVAGSLREKHLLLLYAWRLQSVRSWAHIVEAESRCACPSISSRGRVWGWKSFWPWQVQSPDASELLCLPHPLTWALAASPLPHLGITLEGLGWEATLHLLPISARADAAVFSLSCCLLTLYQQVKNSHCKVLVQGKKRK